MTTMTVIGRLTDEQYISITNLRQEKETIRQDNKSIMTNLGGTEERVKVFKSECKIVRVIAREKQKNKVNHYSLIKNVHSNFIHIYIYIICIYCIMYIYILYIYYIIYICNLEQRGQATLDTDPIIKRYTRHCGSYALVWLH